MNDLAILSCSCDKYSDIWVPMFDMFYKYWGDCPYPVYLMTNQKEFSHDRVKTITTGEDKTWSIAFRQALNTIDAEYVLIIMEDYLLQHPVNSNDFESAISYMKKEKIDCLRTYPCPEPNEYYGMMNNLKIGTVSKKAMYRISLQAAIWRKEYIMSIIDDKDSAWQFEHMGSKRSQSDGSKIVSVYKDNQKLIFDYYCTGVIQGYWIKEAVELCQQNNVLIDLEKRPLEPFSIRFKRLGSDKYLTNLKKYIKKTPFYDLYRFRKYRVK